ncbi:hypothetical protein ABPG72_022214 [Tetrahymena utriculariae]
MINCNKFELSSITPLFCLNLNLKLLQNNLKIDSNLNGQITIRFFQQKKKFIIKTCKKNLLQVNNEQYLLLQQNQIKQINKQINQMNNLTMQKYELIKADIFLYKMLLGFFIQNKQIQTKQLLIY